MDRWRPPAPAGALLAGFVAFGGSACSDLDMPRLVLAGRAPAVDNRPIEVAADGYVSSGACRSCHPQKYASWRDSYHRTMTQVVEPDTVLFGMPTPNRVELELRGERFVVERRRDEFWAEMDDPTHRGRGPPPRVWRQLVMSTGSHHFQVFWLPSGQGRKLSLFPFCYRIDERRWMPMEAAFVQPPQVRMKGEQGRWNVICQQCHATKGKARITEESMDTHAVEFGIACEACHGPGAQHVRANQDPKRRYGLHFSGEEDATIVDPADLPPKRSAQVCGQCHGITRLRKGEDLQAFTQRGYEFQPGEDLLSRRFLVRKGEGYFWSDGMVRVSGREYNALTRTPCFQHDDAERTMTCLSCHQLHQEPDDPRPLEEWRDDQLKPGMRTDLACTQCHDDYTSSRRVAEHTHHEPGTAGSACANCHMPYTTWGLLKAIRSHQVDSPSVESSLATGRPNACNLCHLDRTLAWTATWLEEWYDVPTPALDPDEEEVAAALLWLLKGEAGQRALMSWALGWAPAREASGTSWMPPYLAGLLEDPYAAVRFRAERSLRSLAGYGDLPYDFVGPAPQRAAARLRALEIWEARHLAEESSDPTAVLLDDRGALRTDVFDRLLRARDDRPIILEE